MASIFKVGSVWCVDVYKKGRIRCGKDRTEAHNIHRNIDRLEKCLNFNTPLPSEVEYWLRTIDKKMRTKLVNMGLVVSKVSDVAELCEKWIRTRPDHCLYTHTKRNIVEFFGEHVLQDISKADATMFRKWLLESGRKGGGKLSEATVARRVKAVRSAFEFAVASNWITENPFAEIKAGSQVNSTRSFYIEPSVVAKVMNELPCAELRLVFALARWGGLRAPSEVNCLKWSDVNFDTSTLRIESPKTGLRTCPIFVELRPYLVESFEIAKPGEIYCCPELHKRDGNREHYVKPWRRALKRLNIAPWPKIAQNLRASRATEVANQFGPKAESAWIGHGELVAMRHYLMVTDDVWNRATGQNHLDNTQNRENGSVILP